MGKKKSRIQTAAEMQSTENRASSCILCCAEIHDGDMNSTTTSSLEDRNVRVIFILRKLLNLSASVCSNLLYNYGHPADWISLCSTCDGIVNQGNFLLNQINKLEQEFHAVKEQVRTMVSVKLEIRYDGDDVNSPTNMIRNYVASDTAFVGSSNVCNMTLGGEIYPDILPKIESDENHEDENEMDLDAELLPPPHFLTLDFNLDDNDVVEEEVVDPLGFLGDEILDNFPSAGNNQQLKRQRGQPRKQMSPTYGTKLKSLLSVMDSHSIEDQKDHHNNPNYTDGESFKNASSPLPDLSLSWPEIMAKFPPPAPTSQGDKFIPIGLKEKELDRLTHLATKHGITSFPCPHCSKEISTIPSWSSHVDWCAGKTIGYRCDTCEKVVKTKQGLQSHILSSHTPREELTCRGCRTFYSHWEDFNDHVKERGGDCGKHAVFCTSCKTAFSSEKVCEIHAFCRHGDIAAYKCEVPGCEKRYGTARHLRDHVKSAHSERESFVCDRCGKEFRLKRSLSKHIKTVHLTRDEGAPRFPCDICGREMGSEDKLRRHKETLHIDPEAAPHLCTICGKRFRLPAGLQVHQRSHDPVRKEKSIPKKKGNEDGVEIKTGVAAAKIARPGKMAQEMMTEESEDE